MTTTLDQARQLLDAGDLPGAVRALRGAADAADLGELAGFGAQLARAAGFDDLHAAAGRAAAEPGDPQALYDFGYGCVERGISFLAVPALRAALRLVPDEPDLLAELVSALEDDYRHAEAVRELTDRAAILRWRERYLLTHNLLLSGDIAGARAQFDALGDPGDPRWAWPLGRIARMIRRAEAAAPRDRTDLRGWHFAVHGGYLTTLSPYGFGQGMTGRWAYTQDSYARIRHGLHRLAVVLTSTGLEPRTISPLPDRDSTILGLAAAEILCAPAESFDPTRTDTLVVAYSLGDTDPDLLSALRERAGGQVLFEHASCWTEPAAVPADICTYLAQINIAPWAETTRFPDGRPEQVPADARPAAAIAAEIVRAEPLLDDGDGETPPDPDDALRTFVAATAHRWREGTRDRVDSPGPVRSSRFG